MISSLLYDLNHAPVWQRRVNVWDRNVRAASLDRLIFLGLHRLGWMGGEEVRLLQSLIRPAMRIVDIGANVGLYSLLLARLTGDAGHVYSFEPEPNLFATFAENCTANDATNVTPFRFAAGAENGRARFQRSTLNSGNNSLGGNPDNAASFEVDVARLDDLLPVRKVDFIKIDVQGYEVSALCGMEHVLAASSNVRVLFEFWPGGLRAADSSPESLLDFFSERGFSVYEPGEERLEKLTDPARLIQKLGPNRYANLLAFRPAIASDA